MDTINTRIRNNYLVRPTPKYGIKRKIHRINLENFRRDFKKHMVALDTSSDQILSKILNFCT